jgi:hypothetical protein
MVSNQNRSQAVAMVRQTGRQRQLNLFYDNALGRVNPTFIVFNGTTMFGEPE